MDTRQALSILLVDDNVDACDLVSLYFETEGHNVTTANDGAVGLELALTSSFDVALVDIGLPSIDGYEVARRIKASRPTNSPILVALTGYGRFEDKQRARDAGFDDHIVKPMDMREVQRVIAKHLAR